MIENVQEVEWYYETFGEPAIAGDKLISRLAVWTSSASWKPAVRRILQVK